MTFIRIQLFDLFQGLPLHGVGLLQLFLQRLDLLIDGRGVHLHIDLFLHERGKARIRDQFRDDLDHGSIQNLFLYLLFIITFMTTSHGPVLAAVIVKILIL